MYLKTTQKWTVTLSAIAKNIIDEKLAANHPQIIIALRIPIRCVAGTGLIGY